MRSAAASMTPPVRRRAADDSGDHARAIRRADETTATVETARRRVERGHGASLRAPAGPCRRTAARSPGPLAAEGHLKWRVKATDRTLTAGSSCHRTSPSGRGGRR